jgi:hypothetical protein
MALRRTPPHSQPPCAPGQLGTAGQGSSPTRARRLVQALASEQVRVHGDRRPASWKLLGIVGRLSSQSGGSRRLAGRPVETDLKPLDVGPIALPRQPEEGLFEGGGKQPRSPARASPAPFPGQRTRDQPDGFSIDVARETVRAHAEPSLVELLSGQTSSNVGSALYNVGSAYYVASARVAAQ